MTRTTNARIAGFTYLFYAAIGMCIELLMHQARGVGGDAAKLAHIGQHVMNVRLSILIALLEGLSSLVLAVTLYGITRDEDHELAMLGLVCRVAEGVLGSINNIPNYLGLLWLAKAGVGTDVPVSIAWLGVFASGLLVVVLPLQLAGFNTGPLTGYYQWLPALVFQIVLALWLLIKGVATPAKR
jgi:Domain of unknown function (DUF4386)